MIKNIIANVIGRFWSIMSNFLFIPLYIHFLGFENFSIISFTLILAGIMAILDAGMTATLSREFARADISNALKIKVFLTLEKIYIAVVGSVLIAIIIFSDFIVNNWINTSSPYNLSLIIKVVGFDIAFQMLLKFYMGGLLGAERQVKANLYQILWGLTRNGLVVIIIYFSPNLNSFFIWQAFSTILFAFAFRILLTKTVFKSIFLLKNTFDLHVLKEIGPFALGMMSISFVSAISTQLDKLIISKLLPIAELGYYTISVSLAISLVVLINPIATATLPRLTALFSANDLKRTKEIFLTLNGLVSLFVISMMTLIMIYSQKLIWIWTGDIEIAKNSSLILSIISIAYGALALAVLPYNISIANGNTKFNNYLGVFSILLTIPGYVFFVSRSGAVGAAIVFSVIQVIITIIYMVLVNRKYLKIRNLHLIESKIVLLPMLISLLFYTLIDYFLAELNITNRVVSFISISIVFIIVLAINYLLFISKEEKKSLLSILKSKIPYAK